MSEPALLALSLTLAVALAIAARRFELPYPIVFVLAGTGLAFVPGLAAPQLSPNWIFLAILPPLLFSAGWSTDYVIFRKNLRPILQLAIGLVIFTTVAVALLAQRILPELGLAGAFVLGAVVSPTDAIAAEATFERFTVPRRIMAIIEGDGLLNDATALVVYGYAVAAVTTAAFSFVGALRSFAIVAAGGVALGLVVAWLVERLSRLLARYELADPLIENLLLISTPYAAYLSGEALHVSGVLAVVIAGIAISRRSSVLYGPQTRLIALSVWTLWIYVLNAYMFLAIGLQLRAFVAHGSAAFLAMLPAALAIAALVIGVRLAWVFPAAWIARLIPAIRRRDPLPPPSWLFAIGWGGMRGLVSLAAALALPARFPHREVIVFVTFVVIFVTLVGQGVTLSPLLRWLKLSTGGDETRREIEIRIRALEAGLARIARLERETRDGHALEDLAALRTEYERRIDHLRAHVAEESPASRAADAAHTHAEVEALRAERFAIMALRDEGEIPDDIFRRIQYDLDLAESRLS